MIEVNESNTQDVNRPFPNLVPTEILVFCLYLRSLTPKKVSLQNQVILHIYNIECHSQTSLKVAFVRL